MFNYEIELQNRFIEQLKANTQDNLVIPEFNARFGNVDIVSVNYRNKHRLSKEQASVLSIYQNSKVIGYLNKNAIRKYDFLLRQTGYTDSSLKASLSKLIKSDLVIEVKKNRFIINPDFEFPNLQISSYEAKLKDWKRAIIQANINKQFSNYSYIVLPLNLAQKLSVSKLDVFRSYNIGLIGVSNETTEYLVRPKKESLLLKKNPSFISSIAKLETLYSC